MNYIAGFVAAVPTASKEAASYQQALDLTRQPAERRFLEARLDQLAEHRTLRD
ncbi:hypothetical protein [Mesorhizobium sp. B2-4-19]|uniref:hypothetical protein n=1 Tax=Mesorhizobium sp. B2-4-19 TaxID=2589930 RepID=UPI0015E3496B|nr:hypothetical protein [Mesorhizobium sp. B2-4-19]